MTRSSPTTPRLPYTSTSDWLTARCRQIDPNSSSRSGGRTSYIGAEVIELSEDGGLLFFGGADQTVRLWALDQDREDGNSFVMETKHGSKISSLAISSDSHYIFSASYDKKVLIHDAET